VCLIMMLYAQVMFSILISSMVALHILTSLCAVLLSKLIFPHLLLVVAAVAGELAKDDASGSCGEGGS